MWTRFNPLHSPDCRPAAPLAAGVVESQGSTGQMPPAEVERRNENIAAISQHLSSHETRLYCLQAWFWSAGIFVHHFHWNEQKQKQQVWLCTAEHGSQRWVEQNAISRCENQNWYVRRHIPFHLLSAPLASPILAQSLGQHAAHKHLKQPTWNESIAPDSRTCLGEPLKMVEMMEHRPVR